MPMTKNKQRDSGAERRECADSGEAGGSGGKQQQQKTIASETIGEPSSDRAKKTARDDDGSEVCRTNVRDTVLGREEDRKVAGNDISNKFIRHIVLT